MSRQESATASTHTTVKPAKKHVVQTIAGIEAHVKSTVLANVLKASTGKIAVQKIAKKNAINTVLAPWSILPKRKC